MGAVLRLTLRQLGGRRRLAVVFFLAAVPVGLAILLNALLAQEADFTDGFVGGIIDATMIGIVLPIVVMTLGTAAFGNEVEDRTLNMLVLKPISRLSIVLPKLMASAMIAAPLLVGATVVIVLVALSDGGARAVLAAAAALLVGVMTYAAIFTWAGLLSPHALGFALVYVFLWETLVNSFLPGARYASVRGYTVGVLHGLDDTTFASLGENAIDLSWALALAGLTIVVFTLLTVLRLKRMDVP